MYVYMLYVYVNYVDGQQGGSHMLRTLYADEPLICLVAKRRGDLATQVQRVVTYILMVALDAAFAEYFRLESSY